MATFELIALFGIALALYAPVSSWFERHVAPAPLAFLGAGLALAAVDLPGTDGAPRVPIELLHGVATVTLALVLFTDATRFDLRVARANRLVSFRLLLVAMPLTGAVMVLAGQAFGDLPLVEAALLAALLAPTDAALVDPIVHDPEVPASLRQALNVEAGLNDGLAAPVVFTVASAAGLQVAQGHGAVGTLEGVREVVVGVVLGGAIAYAWSLVATRAWHRGLARAPGMAIGLVGLGLATFVLADVLGGNAYVAAFTAGAVLGTLARDVCRGALDFAEREGQLLAAGVFLLIGVQLLPGAIERTGWQALALAAILFLVARPLAAAVALAGTRFTFRERAFLAWYGPRGLATALFTLLLVGEGRPPLVIDIAIVVVALSVTVHGLTTRLGPRIAGVPGEHVEPPGPDQPHDLTRRGRRIAVQPGPAQPPSE